MELKCRCLELEERVLESERKYIELEAELQKRNKEFESLELRFKELESEKLVVEEELRNLKESKKGSLIEQIMIKESTSLVDLCGSETEERSEKESADARDTLEVGSISESYEDEDAEPCEVNTSTPLSGRKRKQVIASDSEYDDDDEDNIPISSILKKLKPQNQEMPDLVDTPPTTEEYRSRRLRTQRRVSSRLNKQRVSKEISASTERLVGIPTTDNVEDDETEEEELESESESLDGFIVDDDSQETVSEKSDETGEEVSNGESGEEVSDGGTGYADVMSRLRRTKKPEKRKWEYEADMLADFGKDPKLCMRAVCVLYRLQTEDEKFSSSSHYCNGRGFNKYDAARGTYIGSFLTDGDPASDLKKSVEELKVFNSEAVAICEKFACRYSKQVFKIYNNREDPFFAAHPSP